MFDNTESTFIKWLEGLENKCYDLLYEKADEWFQEKLNKSDIENAFSSPIKIYKSGIFYLLRTNIKINQNNVPNIKIYNENEMPLTMDDITNDKKIISVIEIQGIKFTSRSFQIEIELKQVMLLDNDIIFDKCIIQKNNEIQKTIQIQMPKPRNDDDDDGVDSDDESIKEEINNDLVENEKTIIQPLEEDNEIKPLEDKNILESSLENDSLENIEIEEIIDLENEIKEDAIKLKKPEEVYYQIYKEARKKARKLKHQALLAFLEAKNIKKTYKLEDLEEDDSVISDLDFKNIEETLNYNEDI
jgi:hypothetical protein